MLNIFTGGKDSDVIADSLFPASEGNEFCQEADYRVRQLYHSNEISSRFNIHSAASMIYHNSIARLVAICTREHLSPTVEHRLDSLWTRVLPGARVSKSKLQWQRAGGRSNYQFRARFSFSTSDHNHDEGQQRAATRIIHKHVYACMHTYVCANVSVTRREIYGFERTPGGNGKCVGRAIGNPLRPSYFQRFRRHEATILA